MSNPKFPVPKLNGTKLLGVLENCPILLQPDGTVHVVAKAAIDGDGTGSSHGDPDFQPRTSLKDKGNFLNSDVDIYIVVPPAIEDGVEPVVLGCQATVTNRTNGKSTAAVVGDIGPKNKIGEISIACAKALGIDPSPTTGGEAAHVIEYIITPGKPAVVNGKTYALQPA